MFKVRLRQSNVILEVRQRGLRLSWGNSYTIGGNLLCWATLKWTTALKAKQSCLRENDAGLIWTPQWTLLSSNSTLALGWFRSTMKMETNTKSKLHLGGPRVIHCQAFPLIHLQHNALTGSYQPGPALSGIIITSLSEMLWSHSS